MKERATRLSSVHPLPGRAASLRAAASEAQTSEASQVAEATSRRRSRQKDDGIEVQEDELGVITAQRLYRMRCECGRPWFELELPRLVKCPSCSRLNVVSV